MPLIIPILLPIHQNVSNRANMHVCWTFLVRGQGYVYQANKRALIKWGFMRLFILCGGFIAKFCDVVRSILGNYYSNFSIKIYS